MTVLYLLCPGEVTSGVDGDVHFIGASDLAALYGVSMRNCYVRPTGLDPASRMSRASLMARVDRGELIALHPRYDGDYTLPRGDL